MNHKKNLDCALNVHNFCTSHESEILNLIPDTSYISKWLGF
jgi:hypothetical protein